MKDNREPWDEIAALIALDKKAALADFHKIEFIPGALPERVGATISRSRWAMRPAITALAASLFVAAGLASFWLLRGGWGSSSSAPVLSALLADSYLYGQAGSAEAAAPATVANAQVNPYFSAWAAAALQRPADGTAGPAATIKRGDSLEVRRKLSRVIRENALERLLTQFREIHNKEA